MAVGGSLTAVGAAYLDEHAFAAGARGGSDDLARGCGVDVLRREVDDAAQRHERRPVNGTYQGGKPYKKVWQTRYLSAALARYVYVKVAWTKPGERARGMGSSINRQSRSLRGRSLIAP